MKIAIMGTGGVGGYYGGLLAKAGQDVTFIARGAHLRAIREKGLEVRSVHGDFKVHPARATDNPATVGPVDLVMFATKTYHTDQAARAALPLVGERTAVVSFQNGVDAAERVGAKVGIEHVLGGATWLSAAIEAPGLIGQYSQFRRIVIGELDGSRTPRLETVFEALQSTGAGVEISPNIVQVLWTKFVFISAIAAMGALTRVGIGEYRDVPETRALLIEAIKEVKAVAHARGVALGPEVIEQTLAFIDGAPVSMMPSMQRDIEAGKPSELESLVGIVARLGAELSVPTPVMRTAYAVLKPGELKPQV